MWKLTEGQPTAGASDFNNQCPPATASVEATWHDILLSLPSPPYLPRPSA